MPDTPKQEIKLFYCYAREDKILRDELEKYLSSLKRLYSLRNWHDREILPGQEWEQAIEKNLNTAHLVLLLISPDFMNSDYCYGKEMQRALERHAEGTCKVIPIILRPTFLDAAPFNKLQMLPTDAKPITRWSDRDEAFNDVVKEINLVLKDLLLSLKSKKDWLDEGISLRNLKRYEYALTSFEQAIHLDPNIASAYIGRDRALQQLGISRKAQEEFASRLEIAQQQLATQQKRTKQLEIELQEARKPPTARQVYKVSHIAPLVVEKLKVPHTLTDHTDAVWGIAISPDGQTLVSASDDKTIKVWGI